MDNQDLLILAGRGLLEIAEPQGYPVARRPDSMAPAGEQVYQYTMPETDEPVMYYFSPEGTQLVTSEARRGSSFAKTIIATLRVQRDFAYKEGRVVGPTGRLCRRDCYNNSGMAFMVGTIVYPCERCRRGGGNFPFCVTITDPNSGKQAFGGACMSCKHTDTPGICSFWRDGKKEEAKEQYAYAPFPAGGVEGLPTNNFIAPPLNVAPIVRGVIAAFPPAGNEAEKRMRYPTRRGHRKSKATTSMATAAMSMAATPMHNSRGEEDWEIMKHRLLALKQRLVGSNILVPDLQVIDEVVAMNLSFRPSATPSQAALPPIKMGPIDEYRPASQFIPIDPSLLAASGPNGFGFNRNISHPPRTPAPAASEDEIMGGQGRTRRLERYVGDEQWNEIREFGPKFAFQ